MKAILIDGFVKDLSDLEPKDVAIPKARGPRDIKVKITHAALTHVDMLYAQGLHQNNRRHVKPPFILGTEFAGIIVSSPTSSSLRPGTRVFGGGLGSFAEHIIVDEGSIRKIPDQWSNAEACAVGASGAVSWGSLVSMARLKKGETALILGASGGLGVMAVQIAKAIGAKVIAVVGDLEKVRIVKEIGADEVVDYHSEEWEEEVKTLTVGNEGDVGVDVVYDPVGAIESGLKCLKYRGRIVIVGFAGRGGDIEAVKANRILLKTATLIGYRFGEDGRRDPERTKTIWDGFMKLVDAGLIRPITYKERYQGLKTVPQALEDLKVRRTWGRAVLTVDEQAETGKKSKI